MSENNKITKDFPANGFNKNPENINRNGRPPKEESISGLVRDLLRNKPQGQEKTYRELFAMRVMKLALEGDMTAIREIWDRMEGSTKNNNLNLAVQVNNIQVTEEDKDSWSYKHLGEDKMIKHLESLGYKVIKE